MKPRSQGERQIGDTNSGLMRVSVLVKTIEPDKITLVEFIKNGSNKYSEVP